MTQLKLISITEGNDIKEKSAYPIKPAFSYSSINRLAISLEDCIKIIPFDKIVFIEGASNYSIIYLDDGTKITTSKTLKFIAGKLNEEFIRTHKSYIVNLRHVLVYNFRNAQIIMSSNNVVSVSRPNKSEVRRILLS